MKIFFTYLLVIGVSLPLVTDAQSKQSIEMSDQVISVQAKLKNPDGSPAAGVMTYLSVNASPYDLRTAISDDQGQVKFLVPSLPEKGQFIFQTARNKENLNFEVPKPPVTKMGKDVTAPDYLFYDTSIFYGTPDKSYNLDEYTRFATLEEVFREFIAEVKLSKQGDHFSLNVMNRPFKIFFDQEPLILLDGVPVFDNDKLMEVDPLKIKSIDVVARKYYLGALLSYGIVSIFTFEKDLAGYTLPRNAVVSDFTQL